MTLQQLISLKLDSWANSPTRQLKDKADVVELIKSLHLPRDQVVDQAVGSIYPETWDALAAEKQALFSEALLLEQLDAGIALDRRFGGRRLEFVFGRLGWALTVEI